MNSYFFFDESRRLMRIRGGLLHNGNRINMLEREVKLLWWNWWLPVEREAVPLHAVIQVGACGYTEWRSPLIERYGKQILAFQDDALRGCYGEKAAIATPQGQGVAPIPSTDAGERA